MNEISIDTGSNGGLYTKNLLEAASSPNANNRILTVSDVHNAAAISTSRESIYYSPNNKQNPEAILPKLLRMHELLFSINP